MKKWKTWTSEGNFFHSFWYFFILFFIILSFILSKHIYFLKKIIFSKGGFKKRVARVSTWLQQRNNRIRHVNISSSSALNKMFFNRFSGIFTNKSSEGNCIVSHRRVDKTAKLGIIKPIFKGLQRYQRPIHNGTL